MPFVKRDPSGKISVVYSVAQTPDLEQVEANHPELLIFMNDGDSEAVAKRDMLESDLGLARVLEDLVDLLIEKGTFRFTDLPGPAQEKLLARRGLRKEFSYVEALFGEDEGEDYAEPEEGGLL